MCHIILYGSVCRRDGGLGELSDDVSVTSGGFREAALPLHRKSERGSR